MKSMEIGYHIYGLAEYREIGTIKSRQFFQPFICLDPLKFLPSPKPSSLGPSHVFAVLRVRLPWAFFHPRATAFLMTDRPLLAV